MHKKALFLCVAAAFAASAQAVPMITVDADYHLGGDPAVVLPTQTSSAPGGSVDILAFTSTGSNSVGIHTYGDVAGSNLGNRVSGSNTYLTNGLLHYETDATGTFSFSINPGVVSALGSTFFSGGDGQQASIRFLIVADGATPIFDATATASVGFGGPDVATCDAPLGCTITSTPGGVLIFLAGGPQSLTLSDFGLGPGSHTIDYDITAFAQGVVSAPYACVSPPFPPGGPIGGESVGVAGIVEPGSTNCSAIARSGDPLVAAVPAPGTESLLGLGLLGVALSRLRLRRKNSKT